jgi:DNA-directed RNA polymerase subunit RPC12/RpoP
VGGGPGLTWHMALGPRPFPCTQCGKAFPKAYLLKKHQEVHVHERRFRCGDCGKLYKTIAHVRGHRRVHSDERPFPCPQCGKRYKTKVSLCLWNPEYLTLPSALQLKGQLCLLFSAPPSLLSFILLNLDPSLRPRGGWEELQSCH